MMKPQTGKIRFW